MDALEPFDKTKPLTLEAKKKLARKQAVKLFPLGFALWIFSMIVVGLFSPDFQQFLFDAPVFGNPLLMTILISFSQWLQMRYFT